MNLCLQKKKGTIRPQKSSTGEKHNKSPKRGDRGVTGRRTSVGKKESTGLELQNNATMAELKTKKGKRRKRKYVVNILLTGWLRPGKF